jgi:DNA-binding XRE family transcriptional regulator
VELTRGDRLCIQRRRLDETQRQAALRHRVTYHIYSAWENDLPAPAQPPAVNIGRVAPHERALVYRRHAKVTQADVASDIGVCVFTLRKMERGERPCEDLLAYWEN